MASLFSYRPDLGETPETLEDRRRRAALLAAQIGQGAPNVGSGIGDIIRGIGAGFSRYRTNKMQKTAEAGGKSLGSDITRRLIERVQGGGQSAGYNDEKIATGPLSTISLNSKQPVGPDSYNMQSPSTFARNLAPLYQDSRVDRGMLDKMSKAMFDNRYNKAANYGVVAPQAGDLSGYRTVAQQAGIPGKFTGIKDPKRGYHTQGDAMDIGPPRLKGETEAQYNERNARVNMALADAAKANGLQWGGDWRRPDYSHFQNPERSGPVNAQFAERQVPSTAMAPMAGQIAPQMPAQAPPMAGGGQVMPASAPPEMQAPIGPQPMQPASAYRRMMQAAMDKGSAPVAVQANMGGGQPMGMPPQAPEMAPQGPAPVNPATAMRPAEPAAMGQMQPASNDAELIPQMLESLNNPYVPDGHKAFIQKRLEAMMTPPDPMAELSLEEKRLQVEKLRSPEAKPNPTRDFVRGDKRVTQEYINGKWQDIAEGNAFKTTPDTTFNVGSEVGTIPQGYELYTDPISKARSLRPIPGGPAEIEKQTAIDKKAGTQATKATAADVVATDIGRAIDLIDKAPFYNPATGLGAETASKLGGTNAADYKALTDTIEANVSFDRLQEMRDNSPTGGALGGIAIRELELLGATLGALRQSQSAAQAKDNLIRLRNQFLDVVHGVGNGPPRIKPSFEGWSGQEPQNQNNGDINLRPQGWTAEEWNVLTPNEKNKVLGK